MIQVPARFATLRPVQKDAVDQIVDAWTRVPVVIWQGPTGVGKTVGAIAAAQRAQVARMLYVCTGKQLQEQFGRDFQDAVVLKGRSNYPTMRSGFDASHCNKMGRGDSAVCTYCDPTNQCPYARAKQAALHSPLACVNTTYFLTEANGPGGFSGLECAVLDEADELEGELMRYLEFRVSRVNATKLDMTIPRKGVHAKTVSMWLVGLAKRAAAYAAQIKVGGEWSEVAAAAAKQKKQWQGLSVRAAKMAKWYGEEWVRTYDDRDKGDFVLKPVVVGPYGPEMIWQHARQWLVMSATILSPEQFARDLGLRDGEWEFVDSPSTFPVENRPVVVCGVASMTKKTMEEGDAVTRMVEAVGAVVDRHGGENILVHSHTYKLADSLVGALQPRDGRRVFRYGSAKDRERVVEQFRHGGGILVAPSLSRGLDLPDDLCRVVIVAKIPFPYLGDPQISRRMHQPDGQAWLDTHTIRAVIQMCGRAVRHEDDWAVTYILDGQFNKNLNKKKLWFPLWFRDAIVQATARQVLAGEVDLPVLDRVSARV